MLNRITRFTAAIGTACLAAAPLHAQAAHSPIKVQWLGHAAFEITSAGW